MKQTKFRKITPIVLATTLTISSMFFTPTIEASPVPASRPISNDLYSSGKTLQPLGTSVQIDELKNWSPDSDPDARYNKGAINLKERVTGPLVNPNTSTDARVMALCGSTSQSQGTDTARSYAFNYFQYLDTSNFWGGSEGHGVINIPTPERIDAAHRNGVKSTGTIFLPWGDPEFVGTAITQLTQKDANGKYIVADKLLEIAEYYGFDGYFINEESSVNTALATELKNMLKYIQETKPNNFIMQWYDSMVPSGSVNYQDSINENNIGMLQENGVRYNDEAFLNFNWGTDKINKTIDTMKKAGRNPYDTFASWENIPYECYINHPGKVEHLLNENNKIKTSIGLLGPDCTLSASESPEDFTNVKEGTLWVGSSFDPTDTKTRENQTKFPGISSLVADKTVILGTDFVTNFTTGNGHKFYENGVVTGKTKGWNNASLGDILPTWRWIVDSNGTKLKPSIDYADAYWGGTSLKVEGNLQSKNPNHIKLYSTKLNIKSNSKLSITYKTPKDTTNMKVGICFGDSYVDNNFVFLDVPAGTTKNGWTTSVINLSAHANKTAISLSLKFASAIDIADYSINIGRLAITTDTKTPGTIATSNFDEIMFHDYKNAEARIYWDKAANTDYYEIHRIKDDKSKEFVGATPNNAFYLSRFERDGDENEFNYEITPVCYNGERGVTESLNFKWSQPLNTSQPIDNNKPANLALYKHTTCNVISEPNQDPKNLVDGVIPSSKWCVSKTSASESTPHEATIDLGTKMQVGRWVMYNASCPGGNEGVTMNTIDYKLMYSDDNITFKEVDAVTGNTFAITDRNLKETITARYIKLSITNEGSSPWAATRVYELELYEDNKHIAVSEALNPFSVTATNNVGAKDTVRVDKVPIETTVNIYRTLDVVKPFATQKVAQGKTFVEFTGLNFGNQEGRMYYSTISKNISTGIVELESLRRSVPYYAETGNSIVVDNANSDILLSIKGQQNVAPNGVLNLKNIPEGTIIKVFSEQKSILPILTSAPADSAEIIKQERVPLNKDGGNIYIEVYASGYATPSRQAVAYGAISSLKADKSALVDTIAKYSNFVQSDYLTIGWNDFKTALMEVKSLNNNKVATVEKIIRAHENVIVKASQLYKTGNIILQFNKSVLKPGEKQQFGATIGNAYIPNTELNWTIKGNASNNTKIDQTGLLTLGNDETTDFTIKVSLKNDTKVFKTTVIKCSKAF